MYQQGILNGDIFPGFACDDLAGLLFINGKMSKSVTQDKNSNNYFISAVNGHINEEQLHSDIIK